MKIPSFIRVLVCCGTLHYGICHDSILISSEFGDHHFSFPLIMQEAELPPVLWLRIFNLVDSRELYGTLPCVSKYMKSIAEQLQTSLTFAFSDTDPNKLASLASWLATKAKQLDQLDLSVPKTDAAQRIGRVDEIVAALAEQPETLQLRQLALTGFPLCMDEWSDIAQACPHLTILTLHNENFWIDSISSILGSLTGLQHLDLQLELDDYAEDTGNWPPHLTYIRLNCTGSPVPAVIDSEGKPLNYLQQLVLDDCCLGAAFTASLPGFKSSLTRLVLSSCSFSYDDDIWPAEVAASIGQCHGLQELELQVSLGKEFEDISYLYSIDKEEQYTSILSDLPTLPNLTYLRFSNTDDDQQYPLCDLKPFEKKQQQLVALVFDNFRGDPFDLNPLSALTNLTRLGLHGADRYCGGSWDSDLMGQEVKGITALECLKDTLRHLSLQDCHLVPDDLVPVGRLHQLTHLSLAGAENLGNVGAFWPGRYGLQQDDACGTSGGSGEGKQVLEALVGLQKLVQLDLRATSIY